MITSLLLNVKKNLFYNKLQFAEFAIQLKIAPNVPTLTPPVLNAQPEEPCLEENALLVIQIVLLMDALLKETSNAILAIAKLQMDITLLLKELVLPKPKNAQTNAT
jgi:hypothetical protein